MDKKTNEGVTAPSLAKMPVYAGGFKNLTHITIYHNSHKGSFITIKPTIAQLFFYYVLSFIGVGVIFHNIYMWNIGSNESFWSAIFAGGILLGGGIVGLLKSDKYEFFKNSGMIFHKKNRIIYYLNVREYKFDQMHSLQVINKLITTGRGVTPFRSYELNLVFKSGERVNLLHDNKIERLKKAVEKLSYALKIPYSYIDNEQTI